MVQYYYEDSSEDNDIFDADTSSIAGNTSSIFDADTSNDIFHDTDAGVVFHGCSGTGERIDHGFCQGKNKTDQYNPELWRELARKSSVGSFILRPQLAQEDHWY